MKMKLILKTDAFRQSDVKPKENIKLGHQKAQNGIWIVQIKWIKTFAQFIAQWQIIYPTCTGQKVQSPV